MMSGGYEVSGLAQGPSGPEAEVSHPWLRRMFGD